MRRCIVTRDGKTTQDLFDPQSLKDCNELHEDDCVKCLLRGDPQWDFLKIPCPEREKWLKDL